jgi:hypothetical protein
MCVCKFLYTINQHSTLATIAIMTDLCNDCKELPTLFLAENIATILRILRIYRLHAYTRKPSELTRKIGAAHQVLGNLYNDIDMSLDDTVQLLANTLALRKDKLQSICWKEIITLVCQIEPDVKQQQQKDELHEHEDEQEVEIESCEDASNGEDDDSDDTDSNEEYREYERVLGDRRVMQNCFVELFDEFARHCTEHNDNFLEDSESEPLADYFSRQSKEIFEMDCTNGMRKPDDEP